MMIIWPIYKWIAFRKYLEENWLTPVVRRKSAKCAAHVLGFLRSVGDISSIGVFLAIRLQLLLYNAFKTLPAKAAFAKVFNSSWSTDRWSTTSLDATGDARRDLTLICATLTEDPSRSAWYHPISLLVLRTHISEGWYDA
jgi:hypothetical protein